MPSRIAPALLALITLAGAGVISAAPPGVAMAGQGGGATSPDQAAELVRRQTGGRVLSVRERNGGYEVKVLTPSGEVRSVFIPAGGR